MVTEYSGGEEVVVVGVVPPLGNQEGVKDGTVVVEVVGVVLVH